MRTKGHKDLFELIKEHGMTVEQGKKSHYKIRKNGAFICSVSHTGEQNALRQAVRQLVSGGHLPPSAKEMRFS